MYADRAIHISHNVIHDVLTGMGAMEKGMSVKKAGIIRRIREDMVRPDGAYGLQASQGRQAAGLYMDDTTGVITGYGVFDRTSSVAIIHGIIKNSGRLASILSDHGPNFHSNWMGSGQRQPCVDLANCEYV